jgi:hypothetical protein
MRRRRLPQVSKMGPAEGRFRHHVVAMILML